MDVFEILELLGFILRVIGALVFGIGAGWLTLKAFQWEERSWELAVAAFLGLMAVFVLVGRWVGGGGTLGAFGLGVGLGLLVPGLGGLGKGGDEDE
jgi:Kef-type K+ transport system membrane component KefB